MGFVTQGLQWIVSHWHCLAHCFHGQNLCWLAFTYCSPGDSIMTVSVMNFLRIYTSFYFQVISGINRGSNCGYHM
jgi:hypothetical protein